MEWRLYFIGVRVEIDEGKKDIDTILQEVHKDLSDYLNTSDNSDYAYALTNWFKEYRHQLSRGAIDDLNEVMNIASQNLA